MNQTLAASVPRAPVAVSVSRAAPIVAQKAEVPAVSPSNQTAAASASTDTQAAGAITNQVPNQSPSAFAVDSNADLGTAQVAGRVPLGSGWIVTFGIILLLLVVFLVWRFRTNKKGIRAMSYQANLPASPISNVPMSVPPAQKPVPMEAVHRYDAPHPPVSSPAKSSAPDDF
jgi:hypothetical protein